MTKTTSKSGRSKFQRGSTEQASFAQLTESNLLDPKVKGKEARIPWLTAKTSKGLSTHKKTKINSIYFTKQKFQLLKQKNSLNLVSMKRFYCLLTNSRWEEVGLAPPSREALWVSLSKSGTWTRSLRAGRLSETSSKDQEKSCWLKSQSTTRRKRPNCCESTS